MRKAKKDRLLIDARQKEEEMSEVNINLKSAMKDKEIEYLEQHKKLKGELKEKQRQIEELLEH